METLLTFVGIAVAVLVINFLGHVRAINSEKRWQRTLREGAPKSPPDVRR